MSKLWIPSFFQSMKFVFSVKANRFLLKSCRSTKTSRKRTLAQNDAINHRSMSKLWIPSFFQSMKFFFSVKENCFLFKSGHLTERPRKQTLAQNDAGNHQSMSKRWISSLSQSMKFFFSVRDNRFHSSVVERKTLRLCLSRKKMLHPTGNNVTSTSRLASAIMYLKSNFPKPPRNTVPYQP